MQVRTSILLSAALWMTSPTYAQRAGTGAVTGTVRDAYGALIPNAQVKLVEEHIHASWSVYTSTHGTFGTSPLPPGTYSVLVEAEGFACRYMTAVPVNAGEFTRLYLKLDDRKARSELPVNVARAGTPRFDPVTDEAAIGRLNRGNRTDHQSILLVAAIPLDPAHTAMTIMNGGAR